MTAREKFIEAILALEGRPVVWGQLDCSDLVARGIIAAGGPDQTKTHRAQTYFNDTRPLLPLERAVPGDLIFCGSFPDDVTAGGPSIVHVMVVLKNGRVISADGATSAVTDPKVAAKNPYAKVTVHDSNRFRRDLVAVHRNTVVDSLDFITR